MEVVMGYVLTLADKEAVEITQGLGGNGQGELMDELSKTPLARAERNSYTKRDVDTSYLSRFDGTDYCQWHGRKSDGYFHPLGRIMKMVAIAPVEYRMPDSLAEALNSGDGTYKP